MSVLTNVSSSFASKNSNVSIKESFEQGAKWLFQRYSETILDNLPKLIDSFGVGWSDFDIEVLAEEIELLNDLKDE